MFSTGLVLFSSCLRTLFLLFAYCSGVGFVQAQGAKQTIAETPIRDADADHVKERNEWFCSLLPCGGVSNGGSGSTVRTPPVTYTITVTGTSGQLSHSTTVNLVVE